MTSVMLRCGLKLPAASVQRHRCAPSLQRKFTCSHTPWRAPCRAPHQNRLGVSVGKTAVRKCRWACSTNGSVDSAADPGRPYTEQVDPATFELPQDIPEHLEPLSDALGRAKKMKEEATIVREGMEAEAQVVAQLAVGARERYLKATEQLNEATAEAQAASIVKLKLAKQLEALEEKLVQSIGASTAVDATSTVELGTSVDDEAQTQLEQIQEKKQQLGELSSSIQELEDKVGALGKKVQEAEVAAVKAEENASAAMQAAEGAVREEMEAAAVAKETELAMQKALNELTMLEESFEESDEVQADYARKGDQSSSSSSNGSEPAASSSKVTSSLDAIKLAADGVEASPEKKVPAERPVSTKTMQTWEELVGAEPPMKKRQRQLISAAVALAVVGTGAYILANTSLLASIKSAAAAVVAKVSPVVNSIKQQLPSHPGEEGLVETIWLLLTSVVMVPLVCKLPGGSPVLGFLASGALIGPHALGIIRDIEGVRHLAELGVVFLLFNIGLELSLERLQSMQKYVFGMGTLQVVVTLACVAAAVMGIAPMVSGPGAIILGGGLALSSTAVAMQVLADRQETGSRHGRATFSVLLLQDLAVVVLLMLIPLLAPSDSGAANGGSRIAKALGVAAVKAVLCIGTIIAGGRTLLRPMYRRMSKLDNSEIFAATTLLVVLGTSYLTQMAGLSLALGAFLAGLLLAETEFVMQVESDIAPYKGLLMGLFFMTVGMEISIALFFSHWRAIIAGIVLLIVGKVAVMAALGPAFGLSHLQSVRSGLLLAAGGEFAFVTFGEAVSHGILPSYLVSQLFLVVALSMALTPFLAEFGQKLSKMFEKKDVKALQIKESEVGELNDHVIIAGFGRVGYIIAQVLSERLIPFVSLDVDAERVQAGREQDLPVYFGDAGSPGVLHSVGAHRARCAVITLDTPGANYRTVWALHKHYPHLKIYVRAHDVDHGRNLERAGATAVVPETLEPSLQLATAVLNELKMPDEEILRIMQNFRREHLSELEGEVLFKMGTGSTTHTYDEPSKPSDGKRLQIIEAVP